ncbi:MAG: hypothetical protein AAFX09_09715 [Pseudomonadota bacterium]
MTVHQTLTGKPDRRIQTGINQYAMLHHAIRNLASIEPKTATGKLAMNLVAQNSVSVLSVAAISGYVYALTEAQLPTVTFQGATPGPGITNQELQQAYNSFQTQFATFQGEARAWINTTPESGGASIFSQLVSVPTTFKTINGSVQGKFEILKTLTPGTKPYNDTMAQLKALIGAETSDINTLNTAMQTLGTNLQNAAVTLHTAATTGVLKQLQDAYSTEIQSLTDDISQCQDKINSDNSKIVGLGFAAGAAITVGVVGLANIWNPIGWIMMGAGAVGAYFAIAEIERLKGEIAGLKTKIQNDEMWRQDDQKAAASVASFSGEVKGFETLNSAAQKELTTLEQLYSTLADDISTTISDLDADKLDEAQAEWEAILEAAQPLEDLTAYIWPTSLMLPSPTSFAPVGSDVYALNVAGDAFHYASGGNTWNQLPNSALSIVASGSVVAAIDGAPIDGSTVNPNPSVPTYFVKTYNSGSNAWTTISDFPAAAITTGGGDIYAINQTDTDRQVYKYGGSGTSWTKLADLPGPDAASQIAVAGGKVFALANNTQLVYGYDGSSWSQVGTAPASAITGNGDMLGILMTDQSVYTYDAVNGGSPVFGGSDAIGLAQLSNKDQYVVNASSLDLYYIDNNVSPPTATDLQPNTTGVYASDTDAVYYTDNNGHVWLLTDLEQNTWRQLPDLTPG